MKCDSYIIYTYITARTLHITSKYRFAWNLFKTKYQPPSQLFQGLVTLQKGGHVAAEYKHKSLFTIFFLFSGTTNMTYLLDHRTESIIDLTFSRAANRIKEYMAPGFHRRLCELRATATSAD